MNCIHIEFNEIKKALEKAVAPAEKYHNELIDANQKLHEHLWFKPKNDVVSVAPNQIAATSTTDLFATNESNDNDAAHSVWHSNDFQIGNNERPKIKDQYGNSIWCFGEGNDTKLLIDDNENLRVR